jgi:hypothetical protein
MAKETQSASTNTIRLHRVLRVAFPLAPFGAIASLSSERNAVSKSSATPTAIRLARMLGPPHALTAIAWRD